MGRIRARTARADPRCRVVYIVDADGGRAADLAAEVGADAGTEADRLLARRDVDAVVVATPPKYLAPLSRAAMQSGKHVFCEKPMARTVAEAETVRAAASGGRGPRVVVGFTLRYYRAVRRAWSLVRAGAIGEPCYVRGRYGHGGRPGYGGEWRMNTDLSGGGELLDQGVHLIDLGRCFLGEFEDIAGFLERYFWQPPSGPGSLLSKPVEDNAFLLLRTREGRVASLHASWTQWKNLFSFEVFGRDGFVSADGLGGSYGPERLTVGRRRPEGGPPATEEIEMPAHDGGPAPDFPAGDVWSAEWSGFVSTVFGTGGDAIPPHDAGPAAATALDACRALGVIEKIYGSGGSAQE